MRKKYNGLYKKPVVTAIKLDYQQAIIVACQVSGAYFIGTVSECYPLGGADSACNTAVRGRRGSFRFAAAPTQTQPS